MSLWLVAAEVIYFVDTIPFLRTTLQVAMETMHFHIAQICLFLVILFFAFRGYQRTIWHRYCRMSIMSLLSLVPPVLCYRYLLAIPNEFSSFRLLFVNCSLSEAGFPDNK